jgi:hypothetical protein
MKSKLAFVRQLRFHPKENCIFLALLCSYLFAEEHDIKYKSRLGKS